MVSTSLQFSQQKYVFLRSLLDAFEAMSLYDYAVNLVEKIQWIDDRLVPGSPALYGEARMEDLLVTLLPRIEVASGLSLYPTCSYLRVYKRDDALPKHTDRSACEISVSLNLGYEADAPWPLWIQGPAEPSSIAMQPGDAVLYRGVECAHWRDAFSGERAAQVFLHYVDRNGPYAEWKFDQRTKWQVLERFSHLQ